MKWLRKLLHRETARECRARKQVYEDKGYYEAITLLVKSVSKGRDDYLEVSGDLRQLHENNSYYNDEHQLYDQGVLCALYDMDRLVCKIQQESTSQDEHDDYVLEVAEHMKRKLKIRKRK